MSSTPLHEILDTPLQRGGLIRQVGGQASSGKKITVRHLTFADQKYLTTLCWQDNHQIKIETLKLLP